ncbi:MAG: SDR family oxidoreductase [Planctomycetes bacterium]|nr:SDR family oxidoreductase [Planctomycetota bacterium]
MKDLGIEGAVALVTGASNGIGKAIAEALRDGGAIVVGADLSEGDGVHACDVTDRAQVDGLVAKIAETHGGIDFIVHAAGITRDNVLWKLEDEDWNAVMRVNLDAAFLILRAASPHLRQSKRGRVVLITSINGERGKRGQANYAASKAGLIGLAKSAAREFGRDGVCVNAIAPGLIDTAMTLNLPEKIRAQSISESVLGKSGTPEDIAGAALFLCSSWASHVTGQVLRVDGGQLIA